MRIYLRNGIASTTWNVKFLKSLLFRSTIFLQIHWRCLPWSCSATYTTGANHNDEDDDDDVDDDDDDDGEYDDGDEDDDDDEDDDVDDGDDDDDEQGDTEERVYEAGKLHGTATFTSHTGDREERFFYIISISRILLLHF